MSVSTINKMYYEIYKLSFEKKIHLIRHRQKYRGVYDGFLKKHKVINPHTDPQPEKCERGCKGCDVKDWDCQTPVLILSCSKGIFDLRPLSALIEEPLENVWKRIDSVIENEKETKRLHSYNMAE